MAVAQEVGDLVACGREAQQDGAMHGVESVAAGHRLVPVAAVDARRLGGLDLEDVTARLRKGVARQDAERGTAQQKSASFDRGRHGTRCYAVPQEETR